ncbi:MAG: hypothetical protein ABR608_14215 [Pseudonocardiaceae bacterium]
MDNVMQRENERRRLTVDGWCTDDGAKCTLLVVAEVGGTWALYPRCTVSMGVASRSQPGSTSITAARTPSSVVMEMAPSSGLLLAMPLSAVSLLSSKVIGSSPARLTARAITS